MSNMTDHETGSDIPKLSAPAHRALAATGITHLAQLTEQCEADIAKLHGIGPNALTQLRAALAAKGLTFKAAKPS